MVTLVNNSWASEAGHWYFETGEPAYTYLNAKGEEKNTTLREARKLNLYPSVTTVSRVVSAPALEQYKVRQGILAALTLPRRPMETDDEFISRILSDSKEEAKSAAATGEDGHAALEKSIRGQPYDARWQPMVNCFHKEIDAVFDPGVWNWEPERSFSSREHGYGGRIDLIERSRRFIIDAKSKDGDDLKKMDVYDEHLMQAGAYAMLVFGSLDGVTTGNYFFSRTHPGVGILRIHEDGELRRGWRMFRHALSLWQEKSRYAPIGVVA